MVMSINAKVAGLLYEIGEILTIKGDRFRSRAYSMAAQKVTALTEDISEIKERGELQDIPGIGESIASTITEYLETGESIILQELRESLPKGVPEMIELEGIGPKLAIRLHKELGVVSIETLEEAARNHEIRELKGFGEKSEENILRAIEEYRSRTDRFLLGEVLPIIKGILSYMRDLGAVRRVEVAGSARRRKETVGDLDVLVSSLKPESVSDHFIAMPPVARVLAHGTTKSTVVLDNKLQVDLRVIPPRSYGAALQYFTGSKEHNVKLRTIGVQAGFKLNEYGLFDRDSGGLVAAEHEEEIYKALGMDWMPPELRENTGEIEAAIEGTLPTLVEGEDLKGDLHLHTDWSDGRASLEEMIEKAISMGHEYISITDHTKTLAIANGLDESRLRSQMDEIRRLDDRYPEIRVLTGTECDILGDGSLDISDDVLRDLDWVIASIHSGFRQDSETITQRIIDAIHNDHVDTIGHPTGRLIQRRQGYSLDIDAVLEAASDQGVLMEVNCYPDRLDLSDINCRRAKEFGVMVSLGSDAHVPSELEFLTLGLSVARRGWMEAENVANTYRVEDLLKIRG